MSSLSQTQPRRCNNTVLLQHHLGAAINQKRLLQYGPLSGSPSLTVFANKSPWMPLLRNHTIFWPPLRSSSRKQVTRSMVCLSLRLKTYDRSQGKSFPSTLMHSKTFFGACTWHRTPVSTTKSQLPALLSMVWAVSHTSKTPTVPFSSPEFPVISKFYKTFWSTRRLPLSPPHISKPHLPIIRPPAQTADNVAVGDSGAAVTTKLRLSYKKSLPNKGPNNFPRWIIPLIHKRIHARHGLILQQQKTVLMVRSCLTLRQIRQQTVTISTFLTTLIPVRTSNGIVNTEDFCPQTLRLRRGMAININSLALTGLSDNLLSVVEVIKSQGPVVLTKNGAYWHITTTVFNSIVKK